MHDFYNPYIRRTVTDILYMLDFLVSFLDSITAKLEFCGEIVASRLLNAVDKKTAHASCNPSNNRARILHV